MREIFIKNLTAEEQTWGSKVYQPNEEYSVIREDWPSLYSDEVLFHDLVDKAQISDGDKIFSTKIEAWSWITGTFPQEVIPTTIKNEHSLQPMGCLGDYFESVTDGHVCDITLSNKSQDGLTFSYNSDCPIVPTVGNYVFQRRGFSRSWVTSLDTLNHTLTFEKPNLENGVGVYSKGFYIDFKIEDWEPLFYLWSLAITLLEYEKDSNDNWVLESSPCKDFIELSIVDKYDLFLNDDFCQAYFGVLASQMTPILEALRFEDNGEYQHWTKYYDESWVLNINATNTHTPDGSPGPIFPGLVARVSIFSSSSENHLYEAFLDYYYTAKY